MTVGELQIAAAPVDTAVFVKVRAPANPVLDLILKDATVLSSVIDVDLNFQLTLNPIAAVFRINAPNDTALDIRLDLSNIQGAFKDQQTGEYVFMIDT